MSPREKMSRVATNIYLRKTLEKPKRQRSADFKNEGLGDFTRGEGISTPRARHKGQQPLIKCAKHNFKILNFLFLCYIYIVHS